MAKTKRTKMQVMYQNSFEEQKTVCCGEALFTTSWKVIAYKRRRYLLLPFFLCWNRLRWSGHKFSFQIQTAWKYVNIFKRQLGNGSTFCWNWSKMLLPVIYGEVCQLAVDIGINITPQTKMDKKKQEKKNSI